MSTFLEDDYEVPAGDGKYMRFNVGANKFRILTSPLLGWIDFKDNKPVRFAWDNESKTKGKPDKAFNPAKPVKHFWAFGVWNYELQKIQILEITQSTIQNAIRELSKSDDWGVPVKYDITVKKTGAGKETEYSVIPSPPIPVNVEQLEAFKATPIELSKLISGQDPFEISGVRTEMLSDLPF